MTTEFHPLTLSKIERLTKDAVALSFEVPDNLKPIFTYIQGQHLTLRAQIAGVEVRRSYSICHGVAEQQLTVAIKQIPQGVFSTWANQSLTEGMSLDVMPPQGHFYQSLHQDHHKHYLMLAVGSGITPILSHIQSIFSQEPHSKITLVYGNKSTQSMMFREKISFIKNACLDRFHWVNLFTAEENDAELFNGRISADKLTAMHNAHLFDLKGFDDIFICGPEAMILEVSSYLKQLGYQDSQIHYELFFAESAQQQAQSHLTERAGKFSGQVAKVAVKVAGRKTLLSLAMDSDINVLEAALDAGADVPYACKAGVCATCKAKVVKGQVEMDANHSLTEQEVESGVVLTCQAHPLTDYVEFDFDYT